ncbi:aminotransferase class V-fold PLP-dependent enzyme [Fusibacter ferrireducens]|uniref:Aminotransferase class V-fold PLP-dependent enzyme n=1 Tax=Fusibacter ferrireducens TaxID=2785058 RepID=A0ABR9ZXU9_9FIRM|nr:aminotransferase class V-fold PLP-dependent enzyme [Fusibacter ferrireducens]MBF4694695.1 aminotransferase class V-fold PLP-dependent enzyme [Fusibacter ferrireducens]
MTLNINNVRSEIIGNEVFFKTPYGDRLMTYADYTASGKTLKFIEKYLVKLESMYANSHTDDSITGKHMTSMVHMAEQKIKELLNAKKHYVFTVGTGATGAIHKLNSILGFYYAPNLKKYMELDAVHVAQRPVVFISSYEHHSNELMWRESIAEVVVIGLDKNGCFNLEELKSKTASPKYKGRLKIGSFSAASNVTGMVTPTFEIAKIMHKNDGYAFFDFAASGPYVDIDMCRDEVSYFDGIYLSTHKFLGGPGGSGILVMNKALYDLFDAPTIAGGGTVDYVSSESYDYTKNVLERERAGTPGIMQIFRAALALELKSELGIETIEKIEQDYISYSMKRLLKNKNIEILGHTDPSKRIAILSFNIKYKEGYLHHKFVAKLLNDLFGIQSRAGCACAGPYGHTLLGIDNRVSSEYREMIREGVNSLKPGWVRLNFHYTFTATEVAFICDAIEFIAEKGYAFLNEYEMDKSSGLWSHRKFEDSTELIDQFGILSGWAVKDLDVFKSNTIKKEQLMKQYLEDALKIYHQIVATTKQEFKHFDLEKMDRLKWYYVSHLI